jgi:TolA-binding protein
MNHWKKLSVVVSVCLALGGLSALSNAEDKKPDETLAQYLEHLQTKLDHTAQRINQPNAEGSSVVGLRGAKQESASKQLYWKGKKGKTPVTPEEVKAYRVAIDQARAGKNAEAVSALKDFQTKYPKSALLPDINETLSRLNAAPH